MAWFWFTPPGISGPSKPGLESRLRLPESAVVGVRPAFVWIELPRLETIGLLQIPEIKLKLFEGNNSPGQLLKYDFAEGRMLTRLSYFEAFENRFSM